MEPTPTPTPPAAAPPAQPPTPEPTPTPDPTPPADPPAAGTDEGKGGKDAVLADLAKERDKRQALEQQLADAQASSQNQLDAIAKALGLKDDTPDPAAITQQLQEAQQAAATTAGELARYQAAVEKSVPAHLIEFVTGNTKEEADASADKVLAAFGNTTPPPPARMQPDPSQGPQGAPTSLDAQIAAAEAAGNTKEVIRLKARQGLSNSTT